MKKLRKKQLLKAMKNDAIQTAEILNWNERVSVASFKRVLSEKEECEKLTKLESYSNAVRKLMRDEEANNVNWIRYMRETIGE